MLDKPDLDEESQEIVDTIREAKEIVDESEGWVQADSKDVERLLRVSIVPVEHKVSIGDDEEKIFITLFIKEIPITEQLDMLELFMTFDKNGEAKLKWKQYYAYAYSRMIRKTIPPIKWKQARFFNKKFLKILMEYLPNPFEDDTKAIGAISEDTQKN